MNLVFVAPTLPYPSGGVAVVFEFAKAMARRGHASHVYHVPFAPGTISGLDDIPWFDFGDDGVIHHFAPPAEYDFETLKRADVYFGYRHEGDGPEISGLPIVLIQGYRLLDREYERRAYRSPCPKVCVASWLVDVGLELGVPEAELVHVPLGLRHDKYNLRRPVHGRRPVVSFCYNLHRQKGAATGLEVLAKVKQRVPELEALLFGTTDAEHSFADWISYRRDPSQEELVAEIYNASRVFLCTSDVEGFGLPGLEAMACGAAVVTTDNGGSRDYALHDRTALVAAPGDVDTLVEHVVSLVVDDERRTRIAEAGLQHVRRFDWDESAALLEDFLERYVADPQAYGVRRATA